MGVSDLLPTSSTEKYATESNFIADHETKAMDYTIPKVSEDSIYNMCVSRIADDILERQAQVEFYLTLLYMWLLC